MIPRIRARSTLFRQAQAFFQEHLVGVYRWDDVRTRKAEAVPREKKPNGTPIPLEAGKFFDKVDMYFGPFDLLMLGPGEKMGETAYPCGLIRVSSPKGSCEGPLDATTWQRCAAFIKENHQEEENHGYSGSRGEGWGR